MEQPNKSNFMHAAKSVYVEEYSRICRGAGIGFRVAARPIAEELALKEAQKWAKTCDEAKGLDLKTIGETLQKIVSEIHEAEKR